MLGVCYNRDSMITFSILLLLFVLTPAAVAGKSFAPWVPTRRRDIERIINLANPKSTDVFYELGCGDGRVTVALAKKTGIKTIGLEIAWPLVLICLVKKLFARLPNLEFKNCNIFKENLSRADIIYFFGMPDKIKGKLKGKMEKDLRPGTRIISNAFPVEGWTPIIVDQPEPNRTTIYLYEAPQSQTSGGIK